MAKIEKETITTTHKGNLYLRLFAYVKPFLAQFIAALVLVLAVSAFSLIKPMLISSAIDDYITAYDNPYAIVSADEADIEYEGLYLTKDYEDSEVNQYALMVNFNNQYYLVTDLDASGLEYVEEAVNSNDLSVSGETVVISDSEITGQLLDKEDLKLLRSSDLDGIITIAIMYAVVLILNAVCNMGQRYLLLKTGQDIVYNMRNEIYAHINSLPLRYFDTHAVGQIDTRVTNDVEAINRMFSNVLVTLASNVVLIIGYAVVMLYLNVKMALVSFICLPVVFVLTLVFRKLSRSVYRVIRTKITELNIFLSEHISGMKLIQVFAREEEKYQQFDEKSTSLYNSKMQELLINSIFRPLLSFLANFALAIIVYQGGISVLDGTLTVGTLYLFTSYIRSFFDPIQELAEQFSTLQNSFASAEKIFTILDEENTIIEKEEPVILPEVKGKIEFRHVWFAYDDEDYVLKDVSFVIHPGEKVAFVGATGAGKSSILNLIGRYYDIQKGEILIDDVNIKDLTTKQIREAIGQFQQDVFIFSGDVNRNIRLLNEDITDEQIVAAAKAVNADKFIENLPDKYHEVLAERGSNLSAGQRQLLSFARTLASNPTILVMDEATANIDTETEQLIQDALETLMEGRTTIMVAHRLSTIQHADNIIVMHHGKIREQGTHQQLLAQNGIYKKLYELQLYAD